MKRRLRSLLAGLLDPRPPWWASARLWFIVAFVALLSLGPGALRPHVRRSVHTFDMAVMRDGRTRMGIATGDDVAESWHFSIDTVIVERAGERTCHVRTLPGSSTDGAGRPLRPTPAQDRDAMLRLTAAWTGATPADAAEFNQSTEDLHLMARALSKGSVVERVWWRPLLVAITWLCAALLVCSPLVGFLRGAQEAWFRAQLKRVAARQCPACGYALSGLQSPTCPECGRDYRAAEAEARGALGPDRLPRWWSP